MSRPRLPRPAAALLLAAAGLSVSAVGLELVARCVVGLGTPALVRPDPLLEYAFVPNQQVRRFGNRIEINRYGMRSPDFPPTRPSGQRRVLILGDSVLFGGSMLDQSQIATSLLATKLGPDVVVGNVSAGSWGPGNWLGWVRRYGLLGATDVVLLSSSHDLFDHPTFAPLNPLTHPTRNPASAAWELWELWRLYKMPRLLQRFFGPDGHVGSKASPSGSDGFPASKEASTQQGLADLSQLYGLITRSGARLSVVQFWERSEINSGRMRPGYKEQRQLFGKFGVLTVDAGPPMARCAAASGVSTSALYIDEIHPFTPLGQRCLADVLETALTHDQSAE